MSKVPPSDWCYVQAVLLSSWSHIVGPQIVRMWKPERPELSGIGDGDLEEQLPGTSGHPGPDGGPSCFIAGLPDDDRFGHLDTTGADLEENRTFYIRCIQQVLHGELQHSHLLVAPRGRLLISSEKKLIMYAMVFRSKVFGPIVGNEKEDPLLCLAVVFNYNSLGYLWHLLPLTDITLSRVITMSERNKKDPLDVVSSASQLVNDFCKVISSLAIAHVERSPPSVKTHPLRKHCQSSPIFMERVIVSHLQTCGCSVVLGDSASEVNDMVDTLALFLEPRECIASRKVVSVDVWPYHIGLFLQGLLKDSHGKTDLLAQDVMYNSFPTTVIDIGHRKVRQSPLHLIPRRPSGNPYAYAVTAADIERASFQTVLETGKLVPELLKQALVMDSEKCKRHIHNFQRYLKIKACSLLKMVHRLRVEKTPVTTTLLRTLTGLNDPADFHVVLGTAEKLHPGILSFVMSPKGR